MTATRFDFDQTFPGSLFADSAKHFVQVLFAVPDGAVLSVYSAEFNPSCPNGAEADPLMWIFARTLNLTPPFDSGDGAILVRLPGGAKRFDGKALRGNSNNNAWLGRMGQGQTGPLLATPWNEDLTLVGPTEVVLQGYTAEPTDSFIVRVRGILTELV